MGNTIVTLVGLSCSGKTTLNHKMLTTGRYTEVISTTTRVQRSGEVDGETYHFVTPEEFGTIDMLETVDYNGNQYGGSIAEFEEKFDSGLTPVIIVEPTGMAQINLNAIDQGWRVINVFTDCPPALQAGRFLSRFMQDCADRMDVGNRVLRDIDKVLGEYSTRMVSMQTVEAKWKDKFLAASNAEFIYVPVYDADTEDEVFNQIESDVMG